MMFAFSGSTGNTQLKLPVYAEIGTWTISNMQHSMMILPFSVLDWKYFFWANLFQKFDIISLIL